MEQKTYLFEQHGLSVKQVDLDALFVMEKLRACGFTAYLVGGSVRDLLLHRKPKDFDISTSAEPEEIRKIFRNCILIGRRFRLAHIRFGKKTLEVSTFRSGLIESDELILRDNVWGSPEEDAMRRDFTTRRPSRSSIMSTDIRTCKRSYCGPSASRTCGLSRIPCGCCGF
jgi:poly(A) polymerase